MNTVARKRGRPRKSAVYGPVFSWRYGTSVGVDLLLRNSTCSFQCLYCQLGKINARTRSRKVYVSTEQVLADLARASWRSSHVIAFSGSGEPTLAANLGETIVAVKKATRKPAVVLTNSSLLMDAQVRQELKAADEVACKLDAVSADGFNKLNRPLAGIAFEEIIDGMRLFRGEYHGTLSVQLMLLPGNVTDVERFAPIIASIQPDEVQVNLPSRPRPRDWSLALRGEHQEFQEGHAFRLLPKQDVWDFSRRLASRTGVRVVSPPGTAHMTE